MKAVARAVSRRAVGLRPTRADGIAELRLSAGPGNRLSAGVLADLCAAVDAVESDARVRALLVTAVGRDFCIGRADDRDSGAQWPDGIGRLAAVPVPTIAVLNGLVRAEGLALALACDLRVATVDARLSAGVVGLETAPVGIAARLARHLGPARAAELLLLGRTLRVREAEAWGLVTATAVDGAAARTAALRMAGDLARRGPLALRYAKEAVVRALDLSLDDGIRLEQDLYVLLQTTADRQEGVDAFLTKRRPRFHGR